MDRAGGTVRKSGGHWQPASATAPDPGRCSHGFPLHCWAERVSAFVDRQSWPLSCEGDTVQCGASSARQDVTPRLEWNDPPQG